MLIRCTAWNPSKQKTVEQGKWLEPECYKDPVDATDHAINLGEIALKLDGCDPDITTTITLPLDEYRLLISDAQKKAKEEGCKEGRKEAWDLARRLITCGSDTYTGSEYDSVFGSHNANTIFGMPADDALALDKKYQEDKKELHVGDEVEFTACGTTRKGYVINLVSPALVWALTKDPGTYPVAAEKCKKTGKHSEEIEKAMASFEEGEGGQ